MIGNRISLVSPSTVTRFVQVRISKTWSRQTIANLPCRRPIRPWALDKCGEIIGTERIEFDGIKEQQENFVFVQLTPFELHDIAVDNRRAIKSRRVVSHGWHYGPLHVKNVFCPHELVPIDCLSD